MKNTYKISVGFILINTLFVFSMANAQEKAPVTAKQIIDGTVPGLKYGPKKKDAQPPNNDKQRNYKGSDSKAFLFSDYKSPQQGQRKLSKQAAPTEAGSAKLPSDAPQSTQKEAEKIDIPKHPPMQDEK